MDVNQATLAFVVLAFLGIAALVAIAVFGPLLRLWLQAFLHGTPVSLFRIVGMRLRGNRPRLLIEAYIVLTHSGIPVTIDQVEKAYLGARNQILTRDELVDLVKSALPPKTDAL